MTYQTQNVEHCMCLMLIIKKIDHTGTESHGWLLEGGHSGGKDGEA